MILCMQNGFEYKKKRLTVLKMMLSFRIFTQNCRIARTRQRRVINLSNALTKCLESSFTMKILWGF